jgi:hypothetical protein
MPHVFELAPTGRSKCRGCGQPIAKGELRFGEGLPNPFAEGEMTHWFHPLCAAYKRPEPLVEALGAATQEIPDRGKLDEAARRSAAHPRVPRIDGAERAPSGQARCRHCKELIERGEWRIRLVFHEEGTFSPSGFVHLTCRAAYFETGDILDPVLHFSRGLAADDRAALAREFEASSPS